MFSDQLSGAIWSRIGSLGLAGGRSQHRIVMYHAVSDDPVEFYPMTTGVEEFERHVEFLKRNFAIISLDEAVESAGRGRDLAGTVSITTDDGFRSNLDTVAPILEAAGASATLFCVSRCVGNRHLMWRCSLFVLDQTVDAADLLDAAATLAHESEIRPPGAEQSFLRWSYVWPQDRKDELTRSLWGMLRTDTIEQYLERNEPYLTAGELIDLRSRGFTIGSHSATHPNMTLMQTEEIAAEMQDSKLELERLVGSPVQHFSYPFGARPEAASERAGNAAPGYRSLLGISNEVSNGGPLSWERDSLESGGVHSYLNLVAKPWLRRGRTALQNARAARA